MDKYTMVVAIVAIVMAATVIKAFARRPAKKAETDDFVERATYEEAMGKIAKLEDRIKTLERIVTDRKASLAEEIERL